MEPQDNKQLALRKAISAHEEAQGALADLTREGAPGRFEALVDRIRQNLVELHAASERSEPEDTV